MNGTIMSPGGIGAVDPRAGWRSSSCSSSSSTSVCSKSERLVGQLNSFDRLFLGPLVIFFSYIGSSVVIFYRYVRLIASSQVQICISPTRKFFFPVLQVYLPPYTTYDVYVATTRFRKFENILPLIV